ILTHFYIVLKGLCGRFVNIFLKTCYSIILISDKLSQLVIRKDFSMNKIRQNALMMLALTFIYAGLQVARPAADLAWTNISLSIIIPIIAMIFAFNEKDNKWRWSLVTIEVILLIIMIAMAILKDRKSTR